MASSWEGWDSSWSDVREASWDEDEQEKDPDSYTQVEAAAEFVNLLIDYKMKGILSAKQACLLAYWSGRGGCCGDTSKVGLAPGKQSGKYSAHFDRYIGLDYSKEEFYNVELGRRLKHEVGRVWEPLPLKLPHECFASELATSSSIAEQLRQLRDDRGLPPRYYDLPEVRLTPAHDVLLLFAIYLDGVRYTRGGDSAGRFFFTF